MELNNNVVHILRYGTVAEQNHLEDMIKTYDLLAINGNMVAFMPGAIAEFLVNNFISNENKGYFIDPLTHAFQHSIDFLKSSKTKKNPNPSIKSSIIKMLNHYGEPVKSIILNESNVIPEDFENPKSRYQFCKGVLEFQLYIVENQLREKQLLDYIEFSEYSKENIYPEFLIAPYFYMTSNTFDDWFDLNIDFIVKAHELIDKLTSSKPLFSQLVISKDLLGDNTKLDKIIQSYGNSPASGIAIWIDDFNEHEVDSFLLDRFVYLASSLKSHNKIVYNLYGSFFSIMLTSRNLNFNSNILDGVAHGLEYGESRAVVPVGGGIPTSRYYYYPLHQRLDFTTAYNLLVYLGILNPSKQNLENSKRYLNEICNCLVCKNLLSESMENFYKFESSEFYTINYKTGPRKRPKASKETKEYCLKHYLYCKQREFNNVAKSSKQDLLNSLKRTYDLYIGSRRIALNNLSYLENWVNIFENIY